MPAGAEAVWFADTAEMIAAFARDACAGDTARWWWHALLKGLPGGPLAALAALWAREARHVPAAVEHLVCAGEAARVVAALPPAYVARILAAVAAAFQAPALLAAPGLTTLTTNAGAPRAAASARTDTVRRGTHGGAAGDGDAAPGVVPPAATSPPSAPSRSPAPPPWTGWLPPDAVPPGLAPEQAALLGVSLMLHRAPLVARSTAFIARFVRWRAEAAELREPRIDPPASPESPAPPVRRTIGVHPPSSSPERIDAPPSIERKTIAAEDAAPSEDPHPPQVVKVDKGMRTGAPPSPHRHPPHHDPRDGVDAGDAPAPEAVARETEGAEDAHPGARTEDAEPWSVRVLTPPAEEARAASGACGVFFLVNVLRSLDFFRALEGHYALPPVVGGWGWVELAARALLGPAAAGLADDPVWRVLAELDGRAPDELPGGGFLAPETEAPPEWWIGLFGGSPPAPAPSPPLGMRPSAGLQRFLDAVVPILRARIGAALAAAGADPQEPLETALFRRTGTVEATRTHVDVRMDMDQATLPVRLAGLDANPGWVPELARVVTFYFG